MKKLYFFVSIIAGFVLVISCVSVPQYNENSTGSLDNTQFLDEKAFDVAVFDAQSIRNDKKVKNEQTLLSDIRQIDARLKEITLENQTSARLFALQGRLYLLSNNRSQALACYNEAVKKYPQDEDTVVLGFRLGLISDFQGQANLRPQQGILTLESAITAFKSGRYSESLGLFDLSFLSLQPFYRTAYQSLRDQAWKMMNVVTTDTDLAKLLTVKAVTVIEMMQITAWSTTLLNVYTGGRSVPASDLYRILSDAGLMKSRSTTDSTNITANTVVTRVLCARFLWNLYTARIGNDTVVTMYSRKYGTGGKAVSPVPDVSIFSPDFDAVLGTVENEITVLSDGQNFNPDGFVSGAEVQMCVKQLK